MVKRLKDNRILGPIGEVSPLVKVANISIAVKEDQSWPGLLARLIPESKRLDRNFAITIAEQIERQQQLVNHCPVLFRRVN
jgi:hypothetical protein